jgi:queuine tRNA-ribosyltransferase
VVCAPPFIRRYHLLVHPGPEVVAGGGGLHQWMGHEGALITDSGGFQVFSLSEPSADDGPEMKCKSKTRTAREEGAASLLSVTEHGAYFRSYHDGRTIELTPESSVRAQKAFASDIIIPLDELPPYHISRERLHASVRLSHRWMARSLKEHLKDQRQQAMYGVVHGGTDEELRGESAEYLSSLPFDGFAIGGSLGKDRSEMLELLQFLMPRLPEDKPNHLLGIADPESAEAVVPYGIDTMDSCNPTRIARHGLLLTTDGPLKIKQLKHANDYGPVDPKVKTISHSRSYLHHLLKQHEPLFMTLASQHNLLFMGHLMGDIRRRILNDEI